jgi:hypothetical protein
MIPSALPRSSSPTDGVFKMTDLDNFNLATADKHQLKFYAKSLGLDLSLSMTETTMRSRIEKHITENDLEAPVSEVENMPAKGKRFQIIIPKSADPQGSEPVFVGVQGVGYTIPRAVTVAVPEAVVEVLKNAIQDVVTQDEDGIIHHDYVPAYPFNIVGEVAA